MPIFCYCLYQRVLLVCSHSLLFAICFWGPGALAQIDSVPAEQLAIQQIIDDEDLSDEDFEKLLKAQGVIGEKLIVWKDYVLAIETSPNSNFEDAAKLVDVINYHFAEFLLGRQQDRHYRNIVQLDKKYKIFEEDDRLINLTNYIHNFQDRPKFDSDLRIGSHLKNLRYLNLYTKKGREYGAWLQRARSYLFKRELSFWEDRLGKPVCNQSDIRKVCIEKILDSLPHQSEVDLLEMIYPALCKVNIVHNRQLYRFDLCEDE